MRLLLSALMLLLCANALAAIDVMPFKDEEQEQRFRLLTEQFRCPKCQNNSIADSSSAIAADCGRKFLRSCRKEKATAILWTTWWRATATSLPTIRH
ncbi:cytochrome c heme lyase subunit CcmL / Cytochrome c heme lyase subunit CcmH [Klebsiella michiganensis]|uniref:Cytochrome c-type biogenesis protein n=1 Tax=Klebsiella michiganensis TaxID=1134687 RepID=A0A7H4PMW6_9ENTR|nr:cytochrome c heme lyase subunit CcmL / Cytochrome c heme lyase subunit CcmH [Klebsiella michiganensis]